MAPPATRCLIALGANQGDRRATLDRACDQLAAADGVLVVDRSRWLTSTPVGGPAGQGEFANGAAAIDTTLPPDALLDTLHAIEAGHGRVRRVRWAARPLDLDLLLYGDRAIRTDRLRVPHPRMTVRPFVLGPAASIAPDWRHPELGATLAELFDRLRHGADAVRVAGGETDCAAVAPLLAELLPGWTRSWHAGEETWRNATPNGGVTPGRSAAPKLQILADADAAPQAGTPCLPLAEFPRADWRDEVAAAVRCVWPALGER
ncbi:MAG: 2-amino-4-hydroxy-6-hydroxymethyldihydropteridine diphosphokinase [Planctomycetota bacterium]